MRFNDPTSVAGSVAEGGVTAATVAILQKTVLVMIPFLVPAAPLIMLDCHFGVKAARIRYKKYKREDDRVTFSKGFRKTVGKVFEYACWLIIASSMSIAFGEDWLQWGILGAVYMNEIVSIVGNYLYTKGIDFSLIDFMRKVMVFIVRWIGKCLGIVTEDVNFDDVLKPAKFKRNEKGQFVAKGKEKKP